jgi:hypothetical protein
LRGLEAGADILLARAKTVLAKQEYERPKHWIPIR